MKNILKPQDCSMDTLMNDITYIKYRFKAFHLSQWSSIGFAAGNLSFDSIEEASAFRKHSPHMFVVRLGGKVYDCRIALFKCTMMHEIIE